MEQQQNNKEFFSRYVDAISNQPKTRENLQEYISDETLIEHILFFDTVFPDYKLVADQVISEGSTLVLRGRLQGRHEGELNGIQPTQRDVDIPLVVIYEIENEKITGHWILSDQMALMEQLGASAVPA